VHIGSGEKIGLVDYVPTKDKIIVVNIDKAISKLPNPKDLLDEILSKGRNFKIGEFLSSKGIELQNVKKYDVRWNSVMPDREISTCIKNLYNQTYIPGSAIKGAIRTAFLWYALKKNKKGDLIKESEDKIREGLDQMRKELNRSQSNKKKIRETWKRRIGKEVEKLVFYGKEVDAKYDIFKTIQISDSNPIDSENVIVSTVKIMSATRGNYGWKNFRNKRVVPNHKQATPSFVECIKKDVDIEGLNITINEFLLKNEIMRKIGFNNKQKKGIYNFVDICNEFAKSLIEYEKKFYQDYGLTELSNFYKDIESNITENDAFFLHLGWGSGWHGMTIGTLLDNALLRDLRWEFRLGKNKPFIHKFPKTRKIVFEDNKPAYPLGWVRVSFENP